MKRFAMFPLATSSTLADAIRSIAVDPDESVACRRVVEVALAQVGGAEFAGILELSRRGVKTHGASDPRVERLDQAQYEANEGPGLSAAAADERVVHSADLAVDARWPVFGRAAAALGINSAHCFTLSDGQHSMGALNLYASKPHAFDVDAEAVGAVIAAHAAIVLPAGRKQAHLNLAIESREVIGQAKGILMERYKLSERQAFDRLLTVSQHTNLKLRAVADHLRFTGELPEVD